MNYFKIAVKRLITSAAKSHGVDPKTVLMLFKYSDAISGGNISNFGNLLQMCLTHKDQISSYVEGITGNIDRVEAKLSQAQLDAYQFLYHSIDNYYYRKVQSFDDLSFYPRMEDLFAKKPEPVAAVVKASLPPPVEDTPEEFETLTKIGFVTDEKIKPKFKWNAQQLKALSEVYTWMRTKDRKQVFRFFGFAGVGKTELSKVIADFVRNEGGKQHVPVGDVLFAAYSGKACSVLRSKGCAGADTLHSWLYRPVIDPETGKCKEFVINLESPLASCALLVVDEVSMVNEEMAKDIMSFGCAILVLGDPGQLQPIEGEGWFINAKPDVMLTTIERQAEDNPIIYLATRARLGKTIKPGKYGDSRVYAQSKHMSDEMYEAADQILCGTHTTRKSLNRRMRRVNGKADKNIMYPVKGDRLICTRNNKDAGLYNGTMWTSSQPVMQKIMRPSFKGSAIKRPGDLDVLAFKVRSIDEFDSAGKPYILETQCSLHHFNLDLAEPHWRDLIGSDHWDFGYGITVHKSQGSQWNHVMLIDEASTFREHASKHRYTGITRAAETLTMRL